MDFNLTREQQKLLSVAEQVARECLEPRAALYDESATHPYESWRDLWEHGLLALAVPREYGGLGLDMLTYVMAIEKLTQGCANTAMTLHMHSVVQRYIDALASPRQKARFYPEVVDAGKLFGSWGSEPERRGGSGVAETAITPADGGYVVNGRKHFCTMAGAAHRYMVHCLMADGSGQPRLQMALVPHDASGLQITGQWNTLGMRGTVSPSVSFEDCFVTGEDLLGEPGQADEAAVGLAFGLGYAAIYVGAAQRALDFTIEYCQSHKFEPDPTPLSHSLVAQRHVAEMAMALDAARLALYQSASRWQDSGTRGRAVLAARAKYLATEAALMVTSKAVQTVGGRSAHRHYPLERLFRDVRTSTLMPPNADRSLEIVGTDALGVEDRLLSARYAL